MQEFVWATFVYAIRYIFLGNWLSNGQVPLSEERPLMVCLMNLFLVWSALVPASKRFTILIYDCQSWLPERCYIDHVRLKVSLASTVDVSIPALSHHFIFCFKSFACRLACISTESANVCKDCKYSHSHADLLHDYAKIQGFFWYDLTINQLYSKYFEKELFPNLYCSLSFIVAVCWARSNINIESQLENLY